MFKSLELFRTAHAMASHAGARQSVIAANIANADTPGYRARDVVPFTEYFRPDGATFHARTTRPGHRDGHGSAAQPDLTNDRSPDVAPNGNSVSLEDQMLKAVEVQRQHEKAVAIYRSGLTILRASLGRR